MSASNAMSRTFAQSTFTYDNRYFFVKVYCFFARRGEETIEIIMI